MGLVAGLNKSDGLALVKFTALLLLIVGSPSGRFISGSVPVKLVAATAPEKLTAIRLPFPSDFMDAPDNPSLSNWAKRLSPPRASTAPLGFNSLAVPH